MNVKYLILVSLVLTVILFGCTQSYTPQSFLLGNEFLVKENWTYSNTDANLLIQVGSFTDSRCKPGLECFWQGEVGFEIIITKLNTTNAAQIHLGEVTVKETTVFGNKIELISVDFNKKEAQIKITPSEAVYACTMDARICPDGSAVGRSGPNCEFTPCPNDMNGTLVGGDKDVHGCIPSAGYFWCESKQKCLRVWEEACNVILDCQCPEGYLLDGETCTPKCYYSTPPCLAPTIHCIGTGEDTQIANPASTNCVDNNGILSIVDTNQGQIGMCTLPSGKVCEEWAYLRGECTE